MKFLASIFFVFLSIMVSGQNNSYEKLSRLDVGDKMPDISLGTVINRNGAIIPFYDKLRISDLKNKLVILDFWHTGCPTCIAGFPKMSRLQKRFKDQVQIFLVDPYEDEKKIVKNIALIEGRIRKGEDKSSISNNMKVLGDALLPDNLPVIADAKPFLDLFPARKATGYHVWIYNGVVRHRGISENTNEENIIKFLNGDSISFVIDSSNAYNAYERPFFADSNTQKLRGIKYFSMFSGFLSGMADAYGGNSVHNHFDSATATIRTSLINMNLDDIYVEVLGKKLYERLLTGNPTVINEAKNKFQISQGKQTVQEMKLKRVSCEQIVSASTPIQVKDSLLLMDLNRHFGRSLGIEARIEKRTITAYKLVRINNGRFVKSKSDKITDTVRFVNGKRLVDIKGISIWIYFRPYFTGMSGHSNFVFNSSIIDDTDFSGRMDLTMPDLSDIKSLDELRKYLQNNGLDLVEGETDINVLVIRNT